VPGRAGEAVTWKFLSLAIQRSRIGAHWPAGHGDGEAVNGWPPSATSAAADGRPSVSALTTVARAGLLGVPQPQERLRGDGFVMLRLLSLSSGSRRIDTLNSMGERGALA
jgi:hypothetical protein